MIGLRRRKLTDEQRTRRRGLRQTCIGLATLLLTPLPIAVYMDGTGDGYLMYLRARYELLPPSTPQLPEDQLRVARADRALPTYGVPVLIYHGIGRSQTDIQDRRYVVSRDHFAQQMRALATAGYHAITTQQLAQYLTSGDQLVRRTSRS
ncbi:MAG: hypothetical protein ACXVYV_07325 [Gaiellales bacterium]